MSKRRKSSFFRIEYLIIGIFVLSFFIWAMIKADIGTRVKSWLSSSKSDTEQITAAPVDSLTMRLQELRPIYVIIDNLNMRSAPDLKSTILKKLPLHERIYFTGVTTDSTSQINIGRIIADEPWVKVIHEDGTEGCLYGAGVHFNKTRNPNAAFN
ncbi:MAG: SH3 domain-containing protein [Bacteroidia bacterium]|nr:SH3 domain-containing protein [Bacteroidia bacterium]